MTSDPGTSASAVALPGQSAVVSASVVRVGTIALRTGVALLTAVAVIGTLVAATQHETVGVVAIGAALAGAGAAGLGSALSVRALRRRGTVAALIVAFCGLGLVAHRLQSDYSNVLLALVWISAVVESPWGVVICVVLAWAGFTLDIAQEGAALHSQNGSTTAQSVGELAILMISSGLTLAAVTILRLTLTGLPAGLQAIRAGDGSARSITPALTAAVQGQRVLPRADPRDITAGLSPAERGVLALLAQGLAPKQVAGQLGIATTTVRTHIASAKRKTGARTVEQLVGLFAEADHDQ